MRAFLDILMGFILCIAFQNDRFVENFSSLVALSFRLTKFCAVVLFTSCCKVTIMSERNIARSSAVCIFSSSLFFMKLHELYLQTILFLTGQMVFRKINFLMGFSKDLLCLHVNRKLPIETYELLKQHAKLTIFVFFLLDSFPNFNKFHFHLFIHVVYSPVDQYRP